MTNRQEPFDAILLASGGMDSTVLAYQLVADGLQVIPTFVDYGQHCKDKEYSNLLNLLPDELKSRIHVLDLSSVYSQSTSKLIHPANLWEETIGANDLYIPYRNLLFLAAASAFAQSVGVLKVYSGFIDSNHALEIDCSMEFFSKVGGFLRDYGPVEVIMPFRNMQKSDVARLGLKLGVPISQTYSCQVNPNSHCGACPNCVDRLDALEIAMQ